MRKIILLVILMLWVLFVNAQTKPDTLISKVFKNHIDFISQQHKQRIEEFENPDKYQMVYFDKAIIDRKNHKIYVYSSYDLYWAEEIGATLNIIIPYRLKQKPKYKKGAGGIHPSLPKNF